LFTQLQRVFNARPTVVGLAGPFQRGSHWKLKIQSSMEGQYTFFQIRYLLSYPLQLVG